MKHVLMVIMKFRKFSFVNKLFTNILLRETFLNKNLSILAYLLLLN